ncbi:MAG TPA: hypothetical protein VG965_05905 [Patescibacteria group bacterium]|nr:hypothetical protein [Patescibacteria group bacterium]
MATVDEQIENCLRQLQNLEDIDPFYLNGPLQKLRHFVMFVHTRMEVSMEIFIGDYLFEGSPLLSKIESNRVYRSRLASVIEEMDFVKKINVLQKIKKIDSDTASSLFKVNQYRVAFSHPSAKIGEIKEFDDDNKYLEALKTLIKIYEKFDALFVSLKLPEELKEDLKP